MSLNGLLSSHPIFISGQISIFPLSISIQFQSDFNLYLDRKAFSKFFLIYYSLVPILSNRARARLSVVDQESLPYHGGVIVIVVVVGVLLKANQKRLPYEEVPKSEKSSISWGSADYKITF